MVPIAKTTSAQVYTSSTSVGVDAITNTGEMSVVAWPKTVLIFPTTSPLVNETAAMRPDARA